MGFFPVAVHDTLRKISIDLFYVDRDCIRWWNAQRKNPSEELRILGGWYWAKGRDDEGGPFRTPSAALRDAYYRLHVGIAPPMMSRRDADVAKTLAQPKTATQPKSQLTRRRAA